MRTSGRRLLARSSRNCTALDLRGDDPAMDDGGRAVEGSSAADAACASAAASPGLHWRADPDRWIATLVVRGARTAMHVAGLYRRRDEPVDASAVCGDGVAV